MTIEELEAEQNRLYEQSVKNQAERKAVAQELDTLRRAKEIEEKIANMDPDLKQAIITSSVNGGETVGKPGW